MKTDLSYFGEFQVETFKQAAQIRPLAATVWLSQLAQIQPQQLESILAQIPSERIDPKAKVFAQKLLNYNRTQLLSLRAELTLSSEDLANLYQQYADRTSTLGLSKAKSIAKNALTDGIEADRVVSMLTNNNAAYQDLVSRRGTEQAMKMIVRKAQMELAVSKNQQSFERLAKQNQKSPRRS